MKDSIDATEHQQRQGKICKLFREMRQQVRELMGHFDNVFAM